MPFKYSDPIYGSIEIPDKFRSIVASVVFTRLKNIKQLGLTVASYPGAVHTRFEHTLGTYYLLSKILDQFGFDDQVIKEKYYLSALLSEIGIFPLSYSSRPIFNKIGMNKHEYADLLFSAYLNHELQISGEDKTDILNGCKDSNAWFEAIVPIQNFSYLTPVKLASTIDYVLRDSYYTGRYRKLFDLRFFLSINNYDSYQGKIDLCESLHELHRAVYSLDAVYGDKVRRFITLVLLRLFNKLEQNNDINIEKYKDPEQYVNLDDNLFLFELLTAVNEAKTRDQTNVEGMFNVVTQRIPITISKRQIDEIIRDKELDEVESIISQEINNDPEMVFVLGESFDNKVGYRMFGREFDNYHEAINSEHFTRLTNLVNGIDKTGLSDPENIYFISI